MGFIKEELGDIEGNWFFYMKYEVLTAFAVADFGINYEAENLPGRFVAIRDIDENGDGKISENERNLPLKVLHDAAISAGAEVIPKALCVNIGQGGQAATDDSIYYFEVGDVISMDEQSQLGWDMVKFMELNGLIFPQSKLKDVKVKGGEPELTIRSEDMNQTDFDISSRYRSAWETALNILTYLSGLPFFSGFHLDTVKSILTYLEKLGIIVFVDDEAKTEMAVQLQAAV